MIIAKNLARETKMIVKALLQEEKINFITHFFIKL